MLKIDKETFLRVTELCEFLGITYPTLRKYRRQGRIRGVKVGKRWVYSSSEVKRFLRGDGEGIGLYGKYDPKSGAFICLDDGDDVSIWHGRR